jgi:hypothetical protein
MTDADRKTVLNELESSRNSVVQAVSGLTEAQASARTSDESWSAAACVEHLVVVEERILNRIQQPATPHPPSINDPNREEAMLKNVAARLDRFKGPEGAMPTGRFASLEAALNQFNAVRDRTITFVQTCQEDLRAKTAQHPIIGYLDGVQWLRVIAAHSERHVNQIEEIKASVAANRA